MSFAIKTSKLKKSFGNVIAVNNLDLKVNKGSIFGLVGPDGAGKTTTIRMLCAMMLPDEGKIEIGGIDVVSRGEELKEHIGYMPQRFSLYGDLSVRENLEFYAEIYQVPHQVKDKKINELLEFAKLTNHSYKLADQLSGGMKQKLALSCNLIHTPKFLFLDEPTTGVDPVARREFWKILFDLKTQGTTIFVSTPYMDEAERCDEVGLMYQGEIIYCDKPEVMIKSFKKQIAAILVDDIFKARDILNKLSYIDDVYIYGEKIHLICDDYYNVKEKLAKNLRENNVNILEIGRIEPSLEDIFVTIVKDKKRFEGGERIGIRH
ncbi:MAG: ABC transporter ATP-binding protein [Tepidanaerobacteraceae bacterium]